MKLSLNKEKGNFEMELSLMELKDLQYMLTVSFSTLLDDKIFSSNFGVKEGECSRRCESNLDWRDLICDGIAQFDDLMEQDGDDFYV